MTLQARKIDLIKKIEALEDEDKIEEIEAVLEEREGHYPPQEFYDNIDKMIDARDDFPEEVKASKEFRREAKIILETLWYADEIKAGRVKEKWQDAREFLDSL